MCIYACVSAHLYIWGLFLSLFAPCGIDTRPRCFMCIYVCVSAHLYIWGLYLSLLHTARVSVYRCFLCMYACARVHLYIWGLFLSPYLGPLSFTALYVCMRVRARIYISICMYVWNIYVCMYVWNLYVYIYICMYMYIYVYVYIYIYIYIHTYMYGTQNWSMMLTGLFRHINRSHLTLTHTWQECRG